MNKEQVLNYCNRITNYSTAPNDEYRPNKGIQVMFECYPIQSIIFSSRSELIKIVFHDGDSFVYVDEDQFWQKLEVFRQLYE